MANKPKETLADIAANVSETTTPKSYTYQDGLKRKQELFRDYTKETKVPVYMSPMYAPYLGNVMNVTLNGITIFFPIDGSTHLVPQSFADIIEERRVMVDATIAKKKRLADIQANKESTPGELELI